MRIVITGATGNVGTSAVAALAADPAVDEIVGIARRRPEWSPPKVTWATADITTSDLVAAFGGADVVVHLAWLIQPSRDPRAMWATNVVGTRRVLDAVAASGVRRLVVVSSVGAYSPAPAGRFVDETWPTDGVPESAYSWQKALQERAVGAFADTHPACRVAVLRPALIFKRDAAREIRNLFLGHLVPRRLVPPDALAKALRHSPLPFQCVHTEDVADAIRRAVHGDAAGAFNLAADGVIGKMAGRRERWPARLGPPVALAWRARLVPIDPGWIRLAAAVPLLTTDRARSELGWRPTRDADAVLHELLDGLHHDASFPTPPLAARRPPMEAEREPMLTSASGGGITTGPAG